MPQEACRCHAVSCVLNQITHPKTVPSKPSHWRDSEHSNHNQRTYSLHSLVQLKVHVNPIPRSASRGTMGNVHVTHLHAATSISAPIVPKVGLTSRTRQPTVHVTVGDPPLAAQWQVTDPGCFGVSASDSLPPALKPTRRWTSHCLAKFTVQSLSNCHLFISPHIYSLMSWPIIVHVCMPIISRALHWLFQAPIIPLTQLTSQRLFIYTHI